MASLCVLCLFYGNAGLRGIWLLAPSWGIVAGVAELAHAARHLNQHNRCGRHCETGMNRALPISGSSQMSSRRFPPPWSAEETDACFARLLVPGLPRRR